MYSLNQIELKGKNTERIIGFLALLTGCYFIAPFIVAAIGGLLGLIVAGGIIGTCYFLAPAIGKLAKVLRVKMLKAVAAKYPIETLEAGYQERADSLVAQRDNIKQLIATSSKIFAQIQSFETQFSKPSPRRAQYDSLNLLINMMKSKYENAQKNLSVYGKMIEEKRADYEIAIEVAKGQKLANVGKDFYSKLMEDTALNTIQNGLDLAFAELDASVMDANVEKVLAGQDVQVTVAPAATAKPKQLAAPVSELDFDFNGQASEKVAETRRAAKTMIR